MPVPYDPSIEDRAARLYLNLRWKNLISSSSYSSAFFKSHMHIARRVTRRRITDATRAYNEHWVSNE